MTSALDLLDNIAPAAIVEMVPIRDVAFPVRGMSLREWIAVLKRFPGLDAEPEARGAGDPLNSYIEAGEMARRADAIVENQDMAVAVIAIGFGCPGDPAVEAKIEAKFSQDEQQALFDAVIRLTRGAAGGPLAPGGVAAAAAPANPGKAAALASSSSSTSSSAAATTAPT